MIPLKTGSISHVFRIYHEKEHKKYAVRKRVTGSQER